MKPGTIIVEACLNNKYMDLLKLLNSETFDINKPIMYQKKLLLPLVLALRYQNNAVIRSLLMTGANPTQESIECAVESMMCIFSDKKRLKNAKAILCTLFHYQIDSLQTGNDADEPRRKYAGLCRAILKEDLETAYNIVETLNSARFPGIEETHHPLVFTALFKQNSLGRALLSKGDVSGTSVRTAIVKASRVKNLEAIYVYLFEIVNVRKEAEVAVQALSGCYEVAFLDGVRLITSQGYTLSSNDYLKAVLVPLPRGRDHFEVMSYLLGSQLVNLADCPENPLKYLKECSHDEVECSFNWGFWYGLLLEHGADPNYPKMKEPVIHNRCRYGKECRVLKYFRKLNLIDEEYVNERIWILGLKLTDWMQVKDENTEAFLEERDKLQSVILNVSTSIIPKRSLLDFLLLKSMQMVRLVTNINLRRIYEENEGDFRKPYPHYGTMLNIKYKRGLERKNLIDSAAVLLHEALEYNLTKEMEDNVFQYFSNNELAKWNISYLE